MDRMVDFQDCIIVEILIEFDNLPLNELYLDRTDIQSDLYYFRFIRNSSACIRLQELLFRFYLKKMINI